ncbi:hypothetical protein TorRG33x02_057070 [Trema orientale]|uniref:Uncharacterized protein n=1 Tax=Trema orientale TaxID=63057 RepID=A0A2P5FL41_TREOI|nr:hypothetical protein TorRG33x02_057070 [Trema orientale]
MLLKISTRLSRAILYPIKVLFELTTNLKIFTRPRRTLLDLVEKSRKLVNYSTRLSRARLGPVEIGVLYTLWCSRDLSFPSPKTHFRVWLFKPFRDLRKYQNPKLAKPKFSEVKRRFSLISKFSTRRVIHGERDHHLSLFRLCGHLSLFFCFLEIYVTMKKTRT